MEPSETIDILLESIEADKLVILCGAGLSMADPTGLPNAAAIAAECSTRYLRQFGKELPKPVQENLETVAEHFFARNTFHQVFLNRLVPWDRFKGAPNPGHLALADFLLCGATEVVITTNFDDLIESEAERLGQADYYSCLGEHDLSKSPPYKPLLKLHGCARRDRDNTVWCQSQLDKSPVRERIEAAAAWIPNKLRDTDLLIIGFSSDWNYLLQILERCIETIEPRQLIMVDPSDAATLADKAGDLWAWAQKRKNFHHLQMSGATFLQQLRNRFSINLIERLLHVASDDFMTILTGPNSTAATLHDHYDDIDLYALRRDLSGVLRNRPASDKRPSQHTSAAGAAILLLLQRQAQPNGSTFHLDGVCIRVLSTPAIPLSKIKKEFSAEPHHPESPDIVICAGAIADGGAPTDIVRDMSKPTIVRPGLQGEWITLTEAWVKLGGPDAPH